MWQDSVKTITMGTGVVRNLDWGPKIEKFYDVILVTFFGDAMAITSLK